MASEFAQIELNNQSSPLGFNLNGLYVPINSMPLSVQNIVKNSNKVVLLRETSIPGTSGGGRTTGTMWYKGQVLGFTVEDFVRDKKIPKKTAIPDSFKDDFNIGSFPPSAYTIVRGGVRSKFIQQTYYNGKAMQVGSKSDPTGLRIKERDVFVSDDFSNQALGDAFNEVFIHHGGSEGSSFGCIIFGRTRKSNGTLNSDPKDIQKLNKYLFETVNVIGNQGQGKVENLLILNLFRVPKDDGNVEGQVYDGQTGELISGVEISTNNSEPKYSDLSGNFQKELPEEVGENDTFEFTIRKPGYEPKQYTVTDKKNNLGPVELTPLNVGLELDQIEASQLTPEQVENLAQDKKTFEEIIQSRLTRLILTLTGTTLPFILKLNASFGITKMAKLNSKGNLNMDYLQNQITCPTKPEMDNIISQKNKLTKQLNNSFKLIQSTTKILENISVSTTVLTGVFAALKVSPTPTAIAGIGIPISVVNVIDDIKDDLGKKIEKNKKSTEGTTAIISLTSGILSQALRYLTILDQSIQQCYPDSEQAQEDVSAELTAFTQQQSEQLSPVIDEVNGFTFEVETEKTTNSLKRRRAIAKNQKNVVMLKGEWSFSSVDQILIDELIFYIEQNDLKAD